MNSILTATVDEHFNVRQRLAHMRVWRDEWLTEDEQLRARLRQLNINKPLDEQRGNQIGRLRKRLMMRRVREPLEIVVRSDKPGEEYGRIRQNLAVQFSSLNKEDRLFWLENFVFIMTPDLWRLHEKVQKVLGYCSLGQQRNFLLGGHSGMGKTTYLNWLAALNLPTVEECRNRVPVIKVDAPVSNATPRTLWQRMLLDCGLTYLKGDREEELLVKLDLYLQQCDVELLIVDEIEHISRPEMRRRLLDLSNMTQGIPIICASCNPIDWTVGDVEVAGRWNDYFELPQYTGERLGDLLGFIETLLPFSQASNLALQEVQVEAEVINGPVKLIQQWTGGILRDIMILLRDASRRAIEGDLPCLTPKVLEEAWKDIQTAQVNDFLKETDLEKD
jgi:hypothetical protein